MKRKIFMAFAMIAVLISCNRELPIEQGGIDARTLNYTSSELTNDLVDMNEGFNLSVNGKVESPSVSYTYKAYGEPPYVNSIRTNATSVTAVRDMVFVTWHTLASPYGGSITAYKLNAATGRYSFTDRIDFLDTDFHEAVTNVNTLTGSIEIFAVGQRDPDQSGYLLNTHRGAVVTRIDYDYISDAFDPTSFKELPLPSFGANSIVAAAGSYYIVTGNGNGNATGADGGVYKTDYALTNVSEASTLNDGIGLAVFPGTLSPTNAEISILDRTSPTSFRVRNSLQVNFGLPGNIMASGQNINITGTDVERGGLTWALAEGTSHWSNPDSLLVATGSSGLFTARGNFIADFGTCLSVSYDAGARLIYYAGGEGGLYVLAADGFNGGALINTFDLIGKFTPPSGGVFPGQFDIKDVSVYGSRNIALATGLGGVFFIQRN